MMGCARFERCFGLAHRVQVENVSDDGVIGRMMLHFKLSALIRWGTENGKVSVAQSQKRESAGVHQFQGLVILANVAQPKITISTIVILQVFDGRIGRIQAKFALVVDSLTRIFDVNAKVRDVVIITI